MSAMQSVDYLREAFGRVDPEHDPHAALKYALTFVLLGGTLDPLIDLLTPAAGVGAIGGDPGWEIERRNPLPPVATAYEAWPETAWFRASVDPDGFRLGHPESFHDVRSFAGHVWVAVAVYGRHHPGHMPAVARVLDLLPKAGAEGTPARL